MKLDKQLLSQRFAKHYHDYQKSAIVQDRIAQSLAESVSKHCPEDHVHRALEIGMGTGFLSRRLAALYPHSQWYFNDLVSDAQEWIPATLAHKQALMGDAEHIALPEQLDLITSSSAIQWFRDLGQFLNKAAQSLKAGGVLAFSSFGPQHMKEPKEITGQGLDFPSLENLENVLSEAGFVIEEKRAWEDILYFPTGRSVLEHLRHTGVNSTAAQIWTPRTLMNFCRQYEMRYQQAEGLSLSYHPVLVIAKQQRQRDAAPCLAKQKHGLISALQ